MGTNILSKTSGFALQKIVLFYPDPPAPAGSGQSEEKGCPGTNLILFGKSGAPVPENRDEVCASLSASGALRSVVIGGGYGSLPFCTGVSFSTAANGPGTVSGDGKDRDDGTKKDDSPSSVNFDKLPGTEKSKILAALSPFVGHGAYAAVKEYLAAQYFSSGIQDVLNNPDAENVVIEYTVLEVADKNGNLTLGASAQVASWNDTGMFGEVGDDFKKLMGELGIEVGPQNWFAANVFAQWKAYGLKYYETDPSKTEAGLVTIPDKKLWELVRDFLVDVLAAEKNEINSGVPDAGLTPDVLSVSHIKLNMDSIYGREQIYAGADKGYVSVGLKFSTSYTLDFSQFDRCASLVQGKLCPAKDVYATKPKIDALIQDVKRTMMRHASTDPSLLSPALYAEELLISLMGMSSGDGKYSFHTLSSFWSAIGKSDPSMTEPGRFVPPSSVPAGATEEVLGYVYGLPVGVMAAGYARTLNATDPVSKFFVFVASSLEQYLQVAADAFNYMHGGAGVTSSMRNDLKRCVKDAVLKNADWFELNKREAAPYLARAISPHTYEPNKIFLGHGSGFWYPLSTFCYDIVMFLANESAKTRDIGTYSTSYGALHIIPSPNGKDGEMPGSLFATSSSFRDSLVGLSNTFHRSRQMTA